MDKFKAIQSPLARRYIELASFYGPSDEDYEFLRLMSRFSDYFHRWPNGSKALRAEVAELYRPGPRDTKKNGGGANG